MRRLVPLILLSSLLLAACSQTPPPDVAALAPLTVTGEVPSSAGDVSAVQRAVIVEDETASVLARANVGDGRRFQIELPLGGKLTSQLVGVGAWLAQRGAAYPCRSDLSFTEGARVFVFSQFELRRGGKLVGTLYDAAGKPGQPGKDGFTLNQYIFSDRDADLSGSVACVEKGASKTFTFDLHLAAGWNRASLSRRADAGGVASEAWTMGRAPNTSWTLAGASP